MGDYFQIIVDRDATLAEAEQLAVEIRDWLIEAQVLLPSVRELAPGIRGPEYAPGDACDRAYAELHRGFAPEWPNGADIRVGRQVFHSGMGGWAVICRNCGLQTGHSCSVHRGKPAPWRELFDAAWSDAITEWWESKGPGLLACPECGHAEPVTEWEHDPPWGFGTLGITFRNWPPLSPDFIAELTRRLGHRTILVRGKV